MTIDSNNNKQTQTERNQGTKSKQNDKTWVTPKQDTIGRRVDTDNAADKNREKQKPNEKDKTWRWNKAKWHRNNQNIDHDTLGQVTENASYCFDFGTFRSSSTADPSAPGRNVKMERLRELKWDGTILRVENKEQTPKMNLKVHRQQEERR